MANSKSEKRCHKRIELSCPIEITDAQGNVIGRTRTLNISDGGALVWLPSASLSNSDSNVEVSFSVPRSTANTYLLEEFACHARLVWHRQDDDGHHLGVAIEFHRPMQLTLEV